MTQIDMFDQLEIRKVSDDTYDTVYEGTYHKDPTINTIHRASLLVPEIQNTTTEISFLNHFLLKRQYSNVACKITAIDTNGKKIKSKLHKIDKPTVYNFPLSGMVSESVSLCRTLIL